MSRLFSAFWTSIYPIISQLIFGFIAFFPFTGKIGRWKHKRKVFQQYKTVFPTDKDHHILVLCPSHGEFEAVKAIIAYIRRRNPEFLVEVIFFSTSGVNAVAGNNIKHVDRVNYTPIDTTRQVEAFFHSRNIKGVVISTLAIWPAFLNYLIVHQIPYGFVGAYVKNDFFKKLFIRSIAHYLQAAQYIFTVDHNTSLKLSRYSSNVKDIGDTRIASIEQDFEIKRNVVGVIRSFKEKQKLLVLGSTHEKDEEIIFPILDTLIEEGWKIIIAPHEISRASHLKNDLKNSEIYSDHSIHQNVSILIINSLGLLKYIYQLADVSYVGGGFSNSIHNLLEPLIARSPLIIGPKHFNSPTALSFSESDLIQITSNSSDFQNIIRYLTSTAFKNEEKVLWESLFQNLKVNIEEVILTIEDSIYTFLRQSYS